MNNFPQKVRVGISSCLLGQSVRYDGGHKNNPYIVQTLGGFFEFVPFCPEVASGMGTPRPPIQLRATEQGVRCVGVKDHQLDVTEQLQNSANQQDHWLESLCGYVLKKDSPSCGMERVKVYKKDYPDRTGTGIFAQYIQDHFPLLPMEEEGRLGDPHLRENFIQRVYVMQRWKHLLNEQLSVHNLTLFHSQHKLIAMSHDQNLAHDLGRLAASARKENLLEVAERYGLELMACLKKTASRGNHVNTLQHIQGYLSNKLETDDKAELIDSIENYRQGYLPLVVPITLLRHHFRRMPDPFIDRSFYMAPHPEELAALNNI
ncbi:MAG: DUF523 and DUF1722 domain-containing protein [Gammaproteobacteria bacterium]|jgi:uncharacterized protein YbgA (DUF1722 family)/uncharacterized protein YbbK (DUF523 family)|nr:DUF523 and DUF1722 domain-containing protein [Gammaproteobacteria bacterium]MBT5223752.1 DUF523 and DUF1722 domain-containing protein [Gammaproteobacteria bacterium]MBT5826695.1 DUF523 and DUF1722 domain-containing protein [Gammaproteobacteria bacterium]MBT5966797.1 DUF523 and DUF1722 domain-containing protein [Gammaproteobacteria bacterium]MBT6418774.1 DUF523 and DUF1722 domain-containing protein [Gammaproteobacteria bacterium]